MTDRQIPPSTVSKLTLEIDRMAQWWIDGLDPYQKELLRELADMGLHMRQTVLYLVKEQP